MTATTRRGAVKAPTGPTFPRCGHPTTSDNVVYRQSHPGESFRAKCKACEVTRTARYYQARKDRARKPKPYIVPRGAAYQAAMREAKRAFDRAMATPFKRTGRPRTEAAA